MTIYANIEWPQVEKAILNKPRFSTRKTTFHRSDNIAKDSYFLWRNVKHGEAQAHPVAPRTSSVSASISFTISSSIVRSSARISSGSR